MHKTKASRKKKFRLLLDSAFAKPESFPKLKKKANLAHIIHNYGMSSQAEDKEIYQKAVSENRIVLTINFKDFRQLVKKGQPGILGIESQLANMEIDQIVSDFISDKNPEDLIGKAIRITFRGMEQ